jgi:hypothetical protein
VDHFEFGSPSPAAKAGQQSTVSVVAYDAYENTTTRSLGSPTLTSNLDGSTTGCGGSGTAACSVSQALSTFASDGSATITFTAYKAETGRTLTITAGNSKSSTSDAFTVLPAALDHFIWTAQPAAAQVAGVAFGAVVTAYDRYANVKTNYAPGQSDVSITGLHNSPVPPPIFNGSPAGNAAPDTGSLSWSAGVGTLTGVIDRDAETTQLTITNVTVTGDAPRISQPSSSFTVAPAAPAALAFTQQPLETQLNAIINATTNPQFVAVQAVDAFGNLASNTSIAVAIGANPGSGTLGGTTTKPTNSSGIALFDDLTLNQIGVGYTLVASAPPSSPTASKTSSPFVVAQTVTTCTTKCSGSATKTNNTILSVTTSGTSGTNGLGIALLDPGTAAVAIPNGACPNFQDAPGAAIGRVDLSSFTFGSSGTPSFQFVWRLNKSIVLQIPNNSTSAYDICLGAVWTDPTRSPVPFPTKGGGTAQPFPDPAFPGVTEYWGVLPNCTQKTTTPCVFSRTRNQGDEIVTFNVQWPWDPTPHMG